MTSSPQIRAHCLAVSVCLNIAFCGSLAVSLKLPCRQKGFQARLLMSTTQVLEARCEAESVLLNLL